MAAHALLNASGSARWIPCPGSVALTKDMPEENSSYADDGTRMHTAAAEMLLGQPLSVLLDEEEQDIVQTYVDYVRREADGHQLLVEQRVDYSDVIDVPDSFGTSDAVIFAGDTIVIVDLKTGRGVKVDAEENTQLMLYALGAISTFGVLGHFTEAKLVIVQPRLDHISEWTVPV
jgi:hypothetical protein